MLTKNGIPNLTLTNLLKMQKGKAAATVLPSAAVPSPLKDKGLYNCKIPLI